MRWNRTIRRCIKHSGFTLLEVLAATSIMLVLVGSLYSVFRGALRLREQTFTNIEAGLPRSYIMGIIKKDIAHIPASNGLLAGALIGETEESGESRLDKVEFVTATGEITDDVPWGDLQKVEYYLIDPETDDKTSGKDFIRALSRNLLSTVVEEPEEQKLLKNVASLKITYFDGEYWQDSWDSTTMDGENPAAMKIRIEFSSTETNPSAFPPLEIISEIISKPLPQAGNRNG